MKSYDIPAWYYQQFDADYSLKVPAEGYGGWKQNIFPMNPGKTAVVVMHAWDCGTYDEYPGWYRAIEYIPRANKIADEVFPELLSKIRKSNIRLFHMAGGESYAQKYPGYDLTLDICSKFSAKQPISSLQAPVHDEALEYVKDFKRKNAFVGSHNQADTDRGYKNKDFMKTAMPTDNEPVTVNGEQLHAVCLEYGINHLIYIGFAINWCLQYSPGNMNEMYRRGFLCSTIRQAVTAVENKESASSESNKEHGLWVTAIQNGLVYDLKDIINLLDNL